MRAESLLLVFLELRRSRRTRRHTLLKWHRRSLERRRRFEKAPRESPLVAVNVEAYPPAEHLEHFRFTKDQVRELAAVYGVPDVVNSPKTRQSCTGYTAMAIVLARLSSPGPWRQHVRFFGRRKGTLKTFFYITLQIMYDSCKDRIQRPSRTFLTDARLRSYCDALIAKGCPFSNVFGFIDGTLYRISRPSGQTHWQRSVYSGHKKCHGLKWQGINSPDGIIQFLHGPFSGKAHDTAILEESNLLQVLRAEFRLPAAQIQANNPEQHFMIFGDPGDVSPFGRWFYLVQCHLSFAGYSHVICDVLQAPFWSSRGYLHLPPDQRNFNIRMAKLRISAEWMFKDITQLW